MLTSDLHAHMTQTNMHVHMKPNTHIHTHTPSLQTLFRKACVPSYVKYPTNSTNGDMTHLQTHYSTIAMGFQYVLICDTVLLLLSVAQILE